MLSSKAMTKYLKTYSECGPIPTFPRFYDRALVIPSYDEADQLPLCWERLEKAAQHATKRPLVILVINHPEGSSESIVKSNRTCWDYVVSKTSLVEDLPTLNGTLRSGTNLDVLCLDRMTPGQELPKGQGVGLARKIGSDVLTGLIQGEFVSNPWIVHTDADALVPLEYFNKAPFLNQIESGVGAVLIPFKHLPAGKLEAGIDRASVDRAIQSYDDYLHYYARGLALAESPYAYYSIGSTIAVHVDAYTKVRGFPKKLAGEDFYLLNKVAKVGQILPLDGAPIELIGRLSNRVPFGTGKANRKIYELYQNECAYEVEDPKTFLVLGSFLRAAASFLESGQEGLFHSEFDQTPKIATELWLEYQQPLTDIWTAHGDTAAKLKSFHTWFDAFRTMKFVHLVRDRYIPNIDIDLALRESITT